jgi:ATP citrate (pro-S)-lyase
MSTKAIREYDGKLMLSKFLAANSNFKFENFASVSPGVVLSKLPETNPWLLSTRLVAKPDQLIKRRGKAGLIKLNATWDEAQAWIEERRNKEVQVEVVKGVLDHFLVEPFYPHEQSDEFYVCIHSLRPGDEVLFYHEGGVDVGDVDAKASRLTLKVGEEVTPSTFKHLIAKVPEAKQQVLAEFLTVLYSFYTKLNYSYLEINPIVVTNDRRVVPLDLAAKIDECAKFECGSLWGRVDFPPPFGRPLLPAEQYISELDGKTGASVKLTVLNEKGRVWTMVAGGGASVIYADTLVDLGAGKELANYGEYSGAPDENLTFEYARTILELMTKEKHPDGKILLIGGGIANFTNIAATFKGIIRALTKFAEILRDHKVRIYVRRAGPNYQEGLEMMKNAGTALSLPIEVFGPETHMTAIVSMALGRELKTSKPQLVSDVQYTRTALAPPKSSTPAPVEPTQPATNGVAPAAAPATNGVRFDESAEQKDGGAPAQPVPSAGIPTSAPKLPPYQLFTNQTRAFIYGMQPQAVQNMLDFDFICGRPFPSLAAMVYPFTANHYMKFYWKTTEVLIPVYQELKSAIAKHPEVDVVVNFSSFRSVYESTQDILKYEQIRTVAIIAEGVPERQTRALIDQAKAKSVTIIGPATVGGIKPGCFRIGNTGGMLDNIISSKLYRPGSVAYVARSGGMSNELNNIIAMNSDGVYEGIAIGGDRYPGTTFIDHLLRYEANPEVKILIVLGEVGGIEEYEICKLIKAGKITKPMVAWCIGTCAKIFPYEVQFGHAGACASGQVETADAKNAALKAVGVRVPQSFETFGVILNELYVELVKNGTIQVRAEPPVPSIPVDYEWANKLGLIRKPSAFVSSIVDERGEELIYAGMKISEVIQSSLGLGGTIGLIWFRKRLPDYFCRFIELVLQVTADHGPAVAGAHNTIVAARAGKDLISSLCSGLLTIGPRFGGALDGAAQQFSSGYDSGLSAEDFIQKMRRDKELIMGIGHKVKSLENPDVRVVLIKNFAKKHFQSTEILDFALAVEQLTTKKKSNLILNVDGCIGVCFVDLLRSCGAFTLEESQQYIEMGTLNGLFVLGRSIGFIGHFLDQNRLKQGLYRHPTEDISYLTTL